MPTPNLSIKDIAKKFGKSTWGIRLDLKRGLLPAYKVSGVWRFDETEIDQWLRARHQPGRATRLPEVR